MSDEAPRKSGGSRFLYEPFDATAAKLDTLEKVNDERWLHLERRLVQIEIIIERVERRLWLALFGIVSFILGRAMLTLIEMQIN